MATSFGYIKHAFGKLMIFWFYLRYASGACLYPGGNMFNTSQYFPASYPVVFSQILTPIFQKDCKKAFLVQAEKNILTETPTMVGTIQIH